MKVRDIGSNMTELELGSTTVLFSYQTPVAAHIEGDGYIRTSRKWSVTTSRHINKWLASNRAQAPREVDQSVLDSLTERA
jgi:hypothetical protein